MIGRIVRSADFERVLATPTRARSAHFAVHHLQGTPGLAPAPAIPAFSTELSTGSSTALTGAVDDPAAQRLWLGAVVPRRHARRSVTRSLLKRQIRAAVTRRPELPGGLWVVRLRAPFAREQFPSAASRALGEAARDELDRLLADALRRSMRHREAVTEGAKHP